MWQWSKRQQFKWMGITKEGQKHHGLIEASSATLAKQELMHQGILVKTIRRLPGHFSRRIRSEDLALFTRQLASLSQANLTIAQSLSLLSKNKLTPPLKRLICSLKQEVDAGLTFASALEKQNKHFNETICYLIDAGEKSGTLSLSLEKIATYQEKQHNLKRAVKKALTYPFIVFITALFVTYGLLIFALPQFQALFTAFNTELPQATHWLLQAANCFEYYALPFCLSLVALIGGGFFWKKQSQRFATLVDKFFLNLPLLGSIIKKAAIARFSTGLSLSLAAGIPLVDALKSATKINSNRCYARAAEQILDAVSTGLPLHTSMRHTGLFPPMVTDLVALGEETGSIDAMLVRIYTLFETSLDDSIETISHLIEPCLLLFLGRFIGFILVALYLPIFNLGSVL